MNHHLVVYMYMYRYVFMYFHIRAQFHRAAKQRILLSKYFC